MSKLINRILLLIIVALLGFAGFKYFLKGDTTKLKFVGLLGGSDENVVAMQKAGQAEASRDFTKDYVSELYGFKFRHPENFAVNNASDNIIVVQNFQSGVSLQISINNYDDDDHTITAERIRRDIPDMIVNNPQPVYIGGGNAETAKATGIAFLSTEDKREVRQLWFAYGDYIYQISASSAYDDFTKKLLSTWAFN